MILIQRLKRLWELSKEKTSPPDKKAYVLEGTDLTFTIEENEGKAIIIPYKKRNPIKEIIGEETAI